jgi:hypothetical protein
MIMETVELLPSVAICVVLEEMSKNVKRANRTLGM